MSLQSTAEYLAARLGEPTDFVLIQQLKFSIKYWAAMLIRRDAEVNQEHSLYLRSINLSLIQVDQLDPCASVVQCPVLRTKYKVPRPIRLKDGRLFKFCGEAGVGTRKKSFTYTEPEELEYTKHNKYTSEAIRYCWFNGYIYVFNNLLYKIIALEYAPTDIEEFISCCNGCSDDDDICYPEDMLQIIIEGILNKEFKLKPIEDEVHQTPKTPEETEK